MPQKPDNFDPSAYLAKAGNMNGGGHGEFDPGAYLAANSGQGDAPYSPYFKTKAEYDAAVQRQATENPESLASKAKMAGQALLSGALRVGLPAAAVAAAPATGGASLAAIGGAAGAAGEYLGAKVAGETPTVGNVVAGGITGAVLPGASVARAGIGGMAKEGLKMAATNLGAKAIQSGIDQKPMTTEDAIGAVAGGMAAPLMARGVAAIGDKAGLGREAIDRGVQADIYDAVHAMLGIGVKDRAGRLIKSVVVDPGSIKDRTPSLWKGLSGRASFGQEASIYNADAVQAGAREGIGLSAEARPVSRETIGQVIRDAYAPYQKISAMQKTAKAKLAELERQNLTESAGHGAAVQADSPEFNKLADPLRVQAAADVDALKLARVNASREMDKIHGQSPDASYEKYLGYRKQADDIEQAIEEAAKTVGDPKLLKQLQQSRTRIAQGYDLMAATDLSGIVDARKLGAMMRNGVPLSGNLEKIARFADAVKSDAVPINKVGDPALNGLNNELSGVAIANHPVTGIFAKGVPLVGQFARKQVLSPSFQDKMLATTRENRINAFMQGMARFGSNYAGREADNIFMPPSKPAVAR